jgi:integrase
MPETVIRRGTPNIDVLTSRQYNRICSAIDNLRDLCLIELGMETGRRAGEMEHFTVSGINWDEGEIHCYDIKKKNWVWVGISRKLQDDLKRYINTAKLKHLLFPGRREGRGIGDKQVDIILKEWAKKTGVADGEQVVITWHCLRRSLVSRAEDLGISFPEVQRITQDSPQTLLKYYKKVSLSGLGKKLQRLYEPDEEE